MLYILIPECVLKWMPSIGNSMIFFLVRWAFQGWSRKISAYEGPLLENERKLLHEVKDKAKKHLLISCFTTETNKLVKNLEW